MKRPRSKSDKSHTPQAPEAPAPQPSLPWQVLVLALVGAGVALALLLRREDGPPGLGPRRWAVVAVLIALSLLPPVTRRLFAVMQRVRHPSPRAAGRISLLVAALAAVYFVATAFGQDRDLFPKTHDDQSYLIQMRMLARGRLWMPQHDLADFFDTFYVLVRPKYASMYFHGAALMYVPTVWLGLPTWVMPAMVGGAIVGLLYRIVTELIDGVAGLLAAVLLASLTWFRMFSVLLTSHEPMLLLGLLMFWAWLRWRRTTGEHEAGTKGAQSRAWAWLLALGAFAGWGAITRPVDAICFALPVGVGLALDLCRRPARQWAAAAGLVLAGAAPFLALQLVANRGVTGDWFTTPFRLYLDQSQPGTALGFHAYDPALRPQSRRPQKQDYYDAFYVPYIKAHQPGSLLRTWRERYGPMIAETALPSRAMVALVPLGVLGLAGAAAARRRLPLRVFWAVLPLFVALYVAYTIFLEHYALLVAPALIVTLLLAGRAIEAAWPPWRAAVAVAFAVGIMTAALTTMPELNGLWGQEYAASDETFHVSEAYRKLYANAADLAPAVILFRYAPGDRLREEPVYNTDVAWPDEAPTVRAHDLGERNAEIFRYFAAREPDRMFYRYDRATSRPEKMGTARDLAASAATQPATGPAAAPR